MGFGDGRIVFDKEDDTYYPGQFVSGKLVFDLSDVKSFRGIYAEFLGFCKVHWTTNHSRRENEKTVHYTVEHRSYEEYVNVTTYLVGSKSGEHQLLAGHHTFPFQFQIPLHCPSSFEASDGHVRYEVKVTVDRAFKLDQHKTAMLRVLAPIDLNANPYSKEKIGIEFYKSYCCWCMSAGKVEIIVKVPMGGCVPNQVVPIEVSCKNNSTVNISAIRFQIVENKVFHAQREPDTHSYADTLIEVKKGPIPGHTERNWIVEMEIPFMDVPNLLGCRFIDLDYKFKVKVETSGCHEDDEESRPFLIGTIPLSGPNQSIAPTESTPLSHGISPYPSVLSQPIAGNPPYLNGPNNAPYPNAPGMGPGNAPGINPQNTPYPVSPYPGAALPYPPTSSPYPPTSSPYPPNTSPYPPATSPYPPATSPYPPATSPYPPATSPYPPATSPYPPATSSYPPASSPYPPASSPYGKTPAFTGTTLLKTGNLGFIEGGKAAKMPLLPPSAGNPPYPASPYASASAPAPSTPDEEGKKLSDDVTNSSPFNPNYKGQ